MPEVSVVINCYNGERYLREAIDSVMAQTYRNWEIIFWDNASTDQSAQIARSYADPRMRYFRAEQNVPLGHARKLAIAQARGTWVGFLDVDDLWLPEKLARQMQCLEGTSHVLCYGGVREMDPSGKLIRVALPSYPSGDMLEAQLRQFDINMVTPLLRRQALLDNGLTFDENVTASEEYNLFLRLLAKGTACAVPEVLGCLRVSSGSLTDRSIGKWADERFYTLQQLERENPGLTARYRSAFELASARGQYYKARWHMKRGEAALARHALRQGLPWAPVFRALSLLTFVPPVWHLVHADQLKRRLSTLLRIAQ